MAITLYYIEGITRADEPVFDSIGNQVKFFSDHVVSSIDSGFYPPHYQNEIKLQINDEIDLTKSINYLSLEFGNKVYYYFIDNIKYISEDVISLIVTMDVIQTYMFDVNFVNSQLDRNSITRYLDNTTINRDYLRENLSKSSLINKDFSYRQLQSGYNLHYLIVKCTSIPIYRNTDDNKYIFGSNVKFYSNAYVNSELKRTHGFLVPGDNSDYRGMGISFFNDDSNKRMLDGCFYFIIPLPNILNKSIKFILPGLIDSYTTNLNDLAVGLRMLAEESFVADIFYCDNDIFDHESLGISRISTETNGTVDIVLSENVPLLNYGKVSFIPDKDNGTRPFYSESKLYLLIGQTTVSLYPIGQKQPSYDYVYSDVYSASCTTVKVLNLDLSLNYFDDFTRNTSTKVPFDKKYIPQLIDSNYYSVSGGERCGYTSYPIYNLNGNVLHFHYVFDPTTCTRAIWFNNMELGDNEYSDKYLTLKQNTTIESLPLYSDAWNEWFSRNSALYTIGYHLAKQKEDYRLLDKTLSSTADYASINKSTTDKYTRSSLGYIIDNVNNVTQYLFNEYAIDVEHDNIKRNLDFAPDSERQGNNCILDHICNSNKIFTALYEVADIDDCAREFESKGFKVHISLSNQNLFNYQKRYYYDVIKCSDLNITLRVLNDETTIQEIKDRFKNGLRLWHTDNGVLRQSLGNMFQYDNADVYSTKGE